MTTVVRTDNLAGSVAECSVIECSQESSSPHRHAEAQSHAAPRWVGFRRAIPAVGFAGVCAAAAFTELSADEGTVLCPFRLLTGGWCPGCGCTRALKALVRGDVSASLAMNPWTAILFIQALILSVAMLIIPARTVQWLKQHQVIIGSMNVLVALGIWAFRLTTGVIPLPFS